MRAYLIPLRYNISAALALFLLFTAQTVLAGTAQPLEGPACPCSGEKRQVAEPIGTYENSSPDLAPYDPCYDGIDNDSQSGVDWVDKDQDGKNDAEGDPDCVAPGKKMVDEDGTKLHLVRTRIRTYALKPVQVTDEEGNEQTICEEYLETTQDTTTRFSGCFAPQTEIVMADGAKKPVYQLQVGDMVLNPVTGKAARVGMTVAGPETGPTMEIGIAGAAPIQVTTDHAMILERSSGGLERVSLRTEGVQSPYEIKRADKISVGDRILVADGTYKEVTTARQLPGNSALMVFNFRVDGPLNDPREHMVLTGSGMVTGDLVIQVQLGGKIRGR